MQVLIRQLVGAFHTAQAIHAHLAAVVTKIRDRPVSYNDLIAVFGPARVKVLDGLLKNTGLDWLQRQLAGAGVDFSDAAIQSLFTDLATAGTIPLADADKIKEIGVWCKLQWQDYGLPALPSIAQIQTVIDGLGEDGRAISVAVMVTPQGDSVALSVTAMAGSEQIEIIHSIAAINADDPRLTDVQRVFVKSLLDLVKSYVY